LSFDAGAAIATIGLNMDPFARGMLRSEGMMQLFPKSVAVFLADPLLGLANIAKEAAGALVGIFTEASIAADSMGDLAESIGVAVENLSGLGLVAQQAGGSSQAAADSYRFLGRAIAQAAEGGNEAAEMFAHLGIAATGPVGEFRDVNDVMMELADALAALPPGAHRTDVAMRLLGRSGTQLIPTLAQGSAAIREQIERFEEYGAVVSSEAARSADIWQDALGEMNIAWTGLKMQLAEPLRDALLPYMRDVLGRVREMMPEIRARLEVLPEIIESVIRWISSTSDTVIRLYRENEQLVKTLGTVAIGLGAASVAMKVLAGPISLVSVAVKTGTAAWHGYTAAMAAWNATSATALLKMGAFGVAAGVAVAGFGLIAAAASHAAMSNMSFASSMQEVIDQTFILSAVQRGLVLEEDILLKRQEAMAERLASRHAEEARLRKSLAGTDDLQERLRLEERLMASLQAQRDLAEKMRDLWAGRSQGAANRLTDKDVEVFQSSFDQAARSVAEVRKRVSEEATASARSNLAAAQEEAAAQSRLLGQTAQEAGKSVEGTAVEAKHSLEGVREAFLQVRAEFGQRVQLAIDLGATEDQLTGLRQQWADTVRSFAERQLVAAVGAGVSGESLDGMRESLARLVGTAMADVPAQRIEVDVTPELLVSMPDLEAKSQAIADQQAEQFGESISAGIRGQRERMKNAAAGVKEEVELAKAELRVAYESLQETLKTEGRMEVAAGADPGDVMNARRAKLKAAKAQMIDQIRELNNAAKEAAQGAADPQGGLAIDLALQGKTDFTPELKAASDAAIEQIGRIQTALIDAGSMASSGFDGLDAPVDAFTNSLRGTIDMSQAAQAAMGALGDVSGGLSSSLAAGVKNVDAYAASMRELAKEMDAVQRRAGAVAGSVRGGGGGRVNAGGDGVNVENVSVAAPDEARLARMIAD
jgi:hypothetical protein